MNLSAFYHGLLVLLCGSLFCSSYCVAAAENGNSVLTDDGYSCSYTISDPKTCSTDEIEVLSDSFLVNILSEDGKHCIQMVCLTKKAEDCSTFEADDLEQICRSDETENLEPTCLSDEADYLEPTCPADEAYAYRSNSSVEANFDEDTCSANFDKDMCPANISLSDPVVDIGQELTKGCDDSDLCKKELLSHFLKALMLCVIPHAIVWPMLLLCKNWFAQRNEMEELVKVQVSETPDVLETDEDGDEAEMSTSEI